MSDTAVAIRYVVVVTVSEGMGHQTVPRQVTGPSRPLRSPPMYRSSITAMFWRQLLHFITTTR
jgi:hypothetical protein